MAPIYVRNVTTSNKHIEIAALDFGCSVTTINEFDELPLKGPAILYIVAHAVPDGLRIGTSGIMTEAALAKALEYRKDQPTLVIFDACFAKSFSDIPNSPWPSTFGLIFSCLEYERTWSSGGENAPRVSLFSEVLNKAMKDCIGCGSFEGLQAALVLALGGIQNPFVQASDELLREIVGVKGIKAA